jgi:hypothetical protein
MKTTEEKIEVMRAFEDGKPIECQHRLIPEWRPDETPTWDWENYEYRVKSEPKELWVVVRGEGQMNEYRSTHRDWASAIAAVRIAEYNGIEASVKLYREVVK